MVRVLVIAETESRAEILRDGLQLAGHELTDVVAVDAAFPAAIERRRPDAIVLEVHSPDTDLLDRIADAMGAQQLPLLVFAQDASAEAIERTTKAGAAAYVVDDPQAARGPVIVSVALARFKHIAALRNELSAAQQ